MHDRILEMVWNVAAWFFNMVERQRERGLYAALHKTLYESGYCFQLSFYGTLKTPYDGKHVQARIEIVSQSLLTYSEVSCLYDLCKIKPIDREYTLYVLKKGRLLECQIS